MEVCEEFRKIRDDLFEQVNEWVSINSIEIKTFLPELKKLGEMLSKNWSEKSFHRKLLDDFLKTHDWCEAIWTNEIDGSFIYSNPPEGIENAKVRKWFIKAIKGENFVSEPYISAITKNYCVTISMPVMDKEGKILGVLGCDVGFSKRTEK